MSSMKRSRDKSCSAARFRGRRNEDEKRISRPHSVVDLPYSSPCRSTECPKGESSWTLECDQHHHCKRRRSRSPDPTSGALKKGKMTANEEHGPSHLPAAECTLEISRDGVSGVRSIAGSEVRRRSGRSAGDSGYGKGEGGCGRKPRHGSGHDDGRLGGRSKDRCGRSGCGDRQGRSGGGCGRSGGGHGSIGGGCGKSGGGCGSSGGGHGSSGGGCGSVVGAERYIAPLSGLYYLTGEDEVRMDLY